jgi:probable HAF family extracellular repeat protein
MPMMRGLLLASCAALNVAACGQGGSAAGGRGRSETAMLSGTEERDGGYVYVAPFDPPDSTGGGGPLLNDVNDRGWILGSARGAEATAKYPFLFDGTFTTLPIDVSGLGSVGGMNDEGGVVGARLDDEGNAHGWLLGKDGEIQPLDFPGARSTEPQDVNDEGTVVGNVDLGDGTSHCFLYEDGRFRQYDPPLPNALGVECEGINSRGTVSGTYFDAARQVNAGFFVTRQGRATTIEHPEAQPPPAIAFTQVVKVNDLDEVAGSYLGADGIRLHGFVRRADGTFVSIEPPGATSGGAWSLNNSGEVVGSYRDADDVRHGFVAVPRR